MLQREHRIRSVEGMEENTNYYEQGLAAIKAGNYDLAISVLEKACRENRDDNRVFSCLGAAYAAKGLYEKAIGAFKAAEQLSPGVARIHYNIAQAYEAAGIYSEAEYEYRKALSIDAAYSKAKDALDAMTAKLAASQEALNTEE
jgi:Flp pilus assembly protein TadD